MSKLPAGFTLDDQPEQEQGVAQVLPEGFTIDVAPDSLGTDLPQGFTVDAPVDVKPMAEAIKAQQQQQMTHGPDISPAEQLRTENYLKKGSPLDIRQSMANYGVKFMPSARPAPPKTMAERFFDKLLGTQGAVTPETQAKAITAFEARQAGQTPKQFVEEVGARTGPLERGLKDVSAGAIASGAGMLGFIARLTDDPAAQDLFTRADIKAQDLMPSDPKFIDNLMAGFGSTATLFIPGLGIAKGATAVANVAPRMGLWLGSGAAAGMEAAAEAGQVYENMLSEGKGPQAAQDAADKVFWQNAALVGVTNRLGLFGDAGGQLMRRSMGAAMEAGQEGGQQVISNIAQGKPAGEGVAESMAIGGIVGGAMSGSFRGRPQQQETAAIPGQTAPTEQPTIPEQAPAATIQPTSGEVPAEQAMPAAAMREPETPTQELPPGFTLDEAPAIAPEITTPFAPPSTEIEQSIQPEAPVTETSRKSELPKTVSVGPTSVETTPINTTLYRETDAEGLHDLLTSEIHGSYQKSFVTDDPALAIGQGVNKGVKIEMNGELVSGTEHAKPGTGIIGGKEYQTNYIGKDAIQKVTVSPGVKISRGLTRQLLNRKFEQTKLDDGTTIYQKKAAIEQPMATQAEPGILSMQTPTTTRIEASAPVSVKEVEPVQTAKELSQSIQTEQPEQEVLGSAGAAYQPLYQSMESIAMEPPASGQLTIGERAVALPTPSKPMRRERIRSTLINIIGPRLYEGKIKGQGKLGFYRPGTSEIRVKKYGDVEVMAHEMAHYLDFHYKFNKTFKKLYSNTDYLAEIKPLSYTDNEKVMASEGFAEFVRLWLTRYNSAKMHAPKFTQAFEKLLSTDSKLNKKMHKLQEQMHQWYQQGSDARLAGVMNGNQLSPMDRVNVMLVNRPLELMRQKYVDHIHAAKVLERETQGELLDATQSPYKQLQLINGLEGIFDESLRKGAPYFDKDGSIKFKGPSILDVFGDAMKMGQERFQRLQEYFVARRAQELTKQGRENLLDEGMIRAGLAHAAKWPSFAEKFSMYQKYRENLMEFMVDTGYIEPKAAKTMLEKNKNYVPFNRAVEGVAESFAGSGNLKRLKGGSQNLKNIYDNIVLGDFEHIKGALRSKALRDMYEMALTSQEGSKFLSRIAPDSVPVRAHIEQMVDKVSKAMKALDIAVSKDGLITGDSLDGKVVDEQEIQEFFEKNTEELMFWSYGNKPKTTETKVDSYVDKNGKRVWVEFQKDSELVTNMLDSLNGWAIPKGVAGKALGFAYAVKNIQTALITSMPQFAIPNLARDIQQATLLSGGQFKPVYHNMLGFASMLGHAMGKNTAYSEMLANGGGWGTRVRSSMADTGQGTGFKMPGQWRDAKMLLNNLMNAYVSLIDSPEMSTRAGFYIQQRRAGKSARESAWAAREISTDFRKHGSYAPFVMLQRTIPFHGAFVQSVDRDIRGFMERKGETKLTNLFKTESEKIELRDLKVRMFLVGSTFAAITLLLASMNEDDDWYKDLTEDERVRFFNITIDGERYTIPKPHGFFQMIFQAIETFMDYTKQKEGADAAKVMAYSLAYNLNSDFLPGVINPIFEYAINQNFTGAPIISKSQESLSPELQYTDRTPRIYVNLGQKFGISPDGARHIMRGYTGYLENFISDVTELSLWNEQEWGERPFKSGPKEYFGKQFSPRDVPYRTRWIEKYYEAKGRAVTAQADLGLIVKRMDIDPVLRKKFNYEPTHLLKQLNKQFGAIDAQIADMRDASVRIYYDKDLTATEKENQINEIRREKNGMMKQFYQEVIFKIEKLEKQLEQQK